MHKPIFILGSHKSGTSLVRSLFDGHEDVFAIPIETHFFQHIGSWIDYYFRRTIPETDIPKKQFIENTTHWIQQCNKAQDYQSDSVTKGFFDVDAFALYINDMLGSYDNLDCSNFAYCFESYMEAVFYSLFKSTMIKSMRIVEKSVENAEFAIDLQDMFPDAVFIHILRNPYATLTAIRKYKSLGGRTYPWITPAFRSLYNSYYFLYRNRRIVKNYHLIKYEELVSNPENVVRHLCGVCEINFDRSMLIPTQLGEIWRGNSTAPVSFSGISPQRVDAWKDEISSLEIQIINKYLRHVLIDFSYEPVESNKSVLWPMKHEPIKNYFANRILWIRD